MAWFDDLPSDVVDMVRGRIFAEYATTSAAGVPIDTPTFVFPSEDLATLDIGTGLSYPAKAERARRNPKVGMLLEGGLDEPVVSVAGIAAVRDSDLQANLDRYTAETIFAPNIHPDKVPWEETRAIRLYYLTRVIVCVAPAHIRWWPRRRDMDEAPNEWRAPEGFAFPKSDPAPRGKASEAPKWPTVGWPALRDQALASGLAGHLTLLDPEDHPLPIRVRDLKLHADGFSMAVPAGAPWREGKATLSFAGREIFVGDARVAGGETILTVERALPILPTLSQRDRPAADTHAALLGRMEHELARRGVPAPVIPQRPPTPTAGALLREKASLSLVNAVGNEQYEAD